MLNSLNHYALAEVGAPELQGNESIKSHISNNKLVIYC